jgi:Mg2+/Co2+ transporter CorB
MSDAPLSALAAALVVLLILSGCFSLSETAMMAANRYRLRHLAEQGNRGARLALALLARTDRLLGVILLGNNLVNTAAATLTGVIVIHLFGQEDWALAGGTVLLTFAILVFAEISPKIIGAYHADRLALLLGYVLTPLLRLASPIVSFVNVFAMTLLAIFRLRPKEMSASTRLSPEELRTLVLESGQVLPQKQQAVLLNLFALGRTTVEDIMTPRGNIEAIDLSQSWPELVRQLATSHHTRLVVHEGDLDRVAGILHLRHVAGRINDPEWTADELRQTLQDAYFIPAQTPALAQLQFFQENRQRMGLVVDEYGELLGLVTPDDILEEIVGDLNASTADLAQPLDWDADGSVLVEGSRSLRELNRRLGLDLPLDGPVTLNGLIIEHFQDIPEAGVSIRIGQIPIEIVQTQDRSVKVARIFMPLA